MAFSRNLRFSIIFILIVFTLAHASNFQINNNCGYTIWAAASPGGGKKLDKGEVWTINVPAGTKGGCVWGRTGCNFDGNGKGHCTTGDCNGLLQCQGYGSPPNTLAEYTLNGGNNLDFYDISLVDGFNIPMDFSPTNSRCHDIRCTADINGQCPSQLRTQGGCNNPCTAYNTNDYCCNFGNCGPTKYSKFFKDRCPDAYSYPKDDNTSTFTCTGNNNYRVMFCP